MKIKLEIGKEVEVLNSSDVLMKHGEFGVHHGFFNTIAVVDGKEFYFQCCMEKDSVYNEESDTYDFSEFDFEDSGYSDGICADVNKDLAEVIGWENIGEILEIAAKNFY